MRGSTPFAIALLATLLIETVAAANELTPHARGLNAEGRELLATASARSAVVHTLIDALESTDVVVLVTVEPLPAEFRSGYLTFVSAAGGIRYVAVKINWNNEPLARVAILAHELQHALEVAAAPEIRDTPTLLLRYREIGYEVGPGRWETDGARSAGERAYRDLNGLAVDASPFGIPASPADESARQRRTARQH